MKQLFLLISIFTFNALKVSAMSLNEVAKHIPKNPVILECGAHVGYDTVAMGRKWPNGKLYAIEADPNVFKKLVKRTKALKNVMRFQLALGSENGEALFYVAKKIPHLSENHGGNYAQGSLLPPNPDEWPLVVEFEKAPIAVKVLTLDTWAERNNVEKIDFMWLDMQGSDFNMLMASSKILDTVKVIKIEISCKEYYKGTVLFNEGKRFLEDRGFKLIATESDGGITFNNLHGDALFVRNN